MFIHCFSNIGTDSIDKTDQTGSSIIEVTDSTMSTHSKRSEADEAGVAAEMIDDVCTCVYESCTELLHSSTDVYSTFLLQTTHMLEGQWTTCFSQLKLFVRVQPFCDEGDSIP